MSETKLLIGSLSNDLLRVATLTQRGSFVAASRFAVEAQKWAVQLQQQPVPAYIGRIATEIATSPPSEIPLEKAEKYLMYGVLLQNYALHN